MTQIDRLRQRDTIDRLRQRDTNDHIRRSHTNDRLKESDRYYFFSNGKSSDLISHSRELFRIVCHYAKIAFMI